MLFSWLESCCIFNIGGHLTFAELLIVNSFFPVLKEL